MDPMSVAASVVGLIGAANKICSTLMAFVNSAKGAPKLAQNVLIEVSDISACLSQLQKFLLGTRARSHDHLIMVEQIIVTLSNCVMIFSELEETIEYLKPEQPMQAGRLVKWVLKEQAVSALLSRLQSSKMSLSLMLTTLSW